jgi:hypothetical protein
VIWLLGWAAAAIWSLFAWGAYAVVGWVGGLAATHAGWLPLPPEAAAWLIWAVGPLTSLGLAGVVVVWLLGLLLIGVAALVVRWLVGAAGSRPQQQQVLPPSRSGDTLPFRQAPERDGASRRW